MPATRSPAAATPASGGGGAAEELKIGLAYDAVGRGDRSFNDSAFAGAEAAVEEFGGEYREVTPNEDGSDRAELLAQLAEEGYNPVIAVGFAYDETIAEVAADFPDTTFAQVDGANGPTAPRATTSPACSSPRSRARSSPVRPPR